MADLSKFLNYGDCIYIHSAEDPKSYLSARSILEEKVFFIKSPTMIAAQPMEDIDSTFYENHSELMFVIYPKLNYQAYKNYTKVKPNEDPFKVQLLKKRLDVEEDQNLKLIEKMMSTPVTFGSEIQLYHSSSKSFIRATREKNAINSKIYEIRLSRKGGSGMHLKITPYLTFKKEGEKISLKDFFYLENPKLQASIVYKDIPEFPHRNDSSQPQDIERVTHRNYMPLLELSSTFEKYEAGLRQPDPKSPPNPLGVLLVLPHKQNYNSKTLLWGNYVRLKFMLNTKKTGYFYCDNTIVGNAPNVFCRTLNNPPPHERESFQAIFQIVPLSEELYGTPIEFTDQKEVFIRLRHILTGRYLEIGAEKGKCALSEPVGAYLEQPAIQHNDSSPRRTDHSDQIIVRHRNAKILRDRSSFLLKIASPMRRKGVEVMTHTSINVNNSPANSRIRLDDGPESQKMDNDPSAGVKTVNFASGHEDKSPLLPEGYLDVGTKAELQKPSVLRYFEKTWIKLKNASQDDERIVTVDSVFSLESIRADENNRPLGSLTVKSKEGKDQKPFSWMTKAAYNDVNTQRNFKARFHTRNPLDKEELEALVSAQNDIFFHFSPVSQQEISEIMAVQSRLYPVIKLTSDIESRLKDASPNSKPERGLGINRAFSLLEQGTKAHDEVNKALEKKNKNVTETTEAVRKLAAWLSSEDVSLHVGNMTKQVKQKMMREIGVIDNLMDLLIQLFTKNFLKANSKSLLAYKILTREIFELLQMIIRKNKANNIYVFQWSNLLQNMSLSNTIDNDLGVDKLLSQIFYENIIDINELNEIPEHLNYESYDLKALNIAIALYRYNPVRSLEEKDKIISTLILNDAHRTAIFRKLEKDEQNNYWALGKDGSRIQKIDNSLEYRDKKIFDFSMGVIHLATEVTCSKPQVVKSHLDQVFPIELCTELFENKKWNFLFRSAFLELFTEMYFSVQSNQIETLTFPSKIKFLHTTKVSQQVKDLFELRKEAVLSQFINDRFNIKRFVWDFLSDLHKWTEDEHKYIYSAMKLVFLMCTKGIFNWEELSRLKQTIYQYLKSGLAVIHDEIVPETKFEKKTTNLQSESHVKPNTRAKKLITSKLEERERNYDVDNEDDESDEDKREEEKKEEKKDVYWETVQNDMMVWMQEALKIVEFIEHYELDILQKDFFENEESLKFFNEKLRSGNKSSLHNLEPEIIAKIRQDKEAYVLRYTNDNFVLQNYKNTILLLEMLSINNIVLTTQVVHLLYLNFSRIKAFLSSLDTIELIHQGNIDIFNLFISIYDRLRLSRVQLDSLYGTRRLVKGSEIYQEIDKAMSELLTSLYKGEDSLIEEEDPEGWNELYEIYDGYRIEKTRGKEKQSILRNLNFFEVVVDLFIQLEKGHFCKASEARERYLQNYLYFFGFFCANNPQNQQVMTSNQEFIKALVAIDFPSLQPLLLRVISEMYKDNFSLLIQIPQNNNNVITLLLNKFFDKFNSNDGTNNEFLIHCFRTFLTFFQIKRIFLAQNQVYFAKRFYAKELEHYKIKRLLTQDLPKFLETNKVENHVHAEDSLTVKVPFIISFAIYFLNTFARMVEGPIASTSAACLKNKYYLSIQDIRNLLKEAGDWFNLKLALITFLNHVYIRNKKLEDSEITELHHIVRETMFGEINEYNRFIRNRHLYQRSSRQKFVYSFFNYYSIPTEFKYKATIDEVYHQYVLYGIMETFLFYSQRFKTSAPENDHAILDDYVFSVLPDLQEVWDPNPNQKKNFHLDGDVTPMKNNMLVPLDEPTDPDVADGDYLVPQLNERKKVVHLKKDIEATTKMIKKREKVKDLIVFKKSTASLQPKKTLQEQLVVDLRTIETRHNMELEIIVKFLLQMRLENPNKFKLAVKKFMSVLIDEEAQIHVRQGALSVIRKITNFKNDPEIYHAIQIDLVQLKFIDFFDDVIVNARNEDDRLEFILAMIDFLDDASPLVQRELYETLVASEENSYLETIKKFLLTNFEDFRENERTLTDHKCHYPDITGLVYKMMYRVIYALELLRLSCENHFESMQNHLREQIHANGKNKRSINFINIISDIFSRYIKNLNEKNAILGLKILDTLTEIVQGPCAENQLALCNARILENLQDLIVETSDQRKKKESVIWTEMNNKVITLILSILEGSTNESIVSQVTVHINTSSFLERMLEIHREILKQKKITAFAKTKKAKKAKAKTHGLPTGLAGFERNLLMIEHYNNRENDYKVIANEGTQFGIILNTLTHLSPEISKKVTKYKSEVSEEDEGERLKELLKAENYYNRYIGQIEIVNKKGDLQRIFFPIVDKTKYLSSVTKNKFLDEVVRESSNEKLFGLLRYQSLFEAEMDHFLRLRKKGLKLSLTFFSRIRDLNLLIAFATNVIILFGAQITSSLQADLNKANVSYDNIIQVLGVIHIALCAVALLFWLIFKAPLEIAESLKEFESERSRDEEVEVKKGNLSKSQDILHQAGNILILLFFQGPIMIWRKGLRQLQKIAFIFTHTYFLYLIANLLFALLGSLYSQVFFSLLLLDLIDRSIILNNVVKSVTVNYKQLLMTVVLGILIIYVWAVLGFFAVLEGDVHQENCNTVFQCFLYAVDQGLRAGGGIGEALGQVSYQDKEEFTKRYFYDLFYFVIIIIVLLNIIFGIIIDTFADLRDQKTLKDYDEKNICFICNIDRTLFEKQGKSFEDHTRIEHNLWNYLYFMVYLNTKNKLDYTGTESYVYDKIEAEDLSWFPIQRAYILNATQKEEEEQDVKKIIDEKLENVKTKIFETIASTTNNLMLSAIGSSKLKGGKAKSRGRRGDHKPTYIANP